MTAWDCFLFSDRLTTLQPFTKDRNAILSSLLKTRASGATALYDSMAQLSRDLSKSGGKKAILLFTDGRDNASVLTIDSAVSTIRRIGVPIYTVAEGELLQDRAVLTRLKEISESTNGVPFEARKAEDLRDIFSKIGKGSAAPVSAGLLLHQHECQIGVAAHQCSPPGARAVQDSRQGRILEMIFGCARLRRHFSTA